MSNSLRHQVYNNLNQKPTDELLAIWVRNNRDEWSEMTFELIEIILKERGEEIPPQNQENPRDAHEQITGERDDDENGSPVFYNPQKALRIIDWLEWAAIASLIFISIQGIIQSWPVVSSWFSMPHIANANLIGVGIGLLILIVTIFSAILSYLTLRAVAYILKILMEFEFNSRGVK
jgi:hypothetical protein